MWDVGHDEGSAQELHDRDLDASSGRSVWFHEVDRPTLVLGSTQSADVVDADAVVRHGVAVAKRHSGGGAVFVEPGGATWVDVVVPREDPLWDDDVGRAFDWLGEAWVAALASLGVSGVSHRGGLVRTRFSSLVCFAGLGPGEVTVTRGPDGGGAPRKLVGISQRRTRTQARFQCIVHRRFDPVDTVRVLALSASDPAAAADLADVLAAGVATAEFEPDQLEPALLAALPN